MRKNKGITAENKSVPFFMRRGNYNEARNVAIYLMRKHTGASLSEIGNRFAMRSYSSVSSVIQRMEQALKADIGLRKRMADVEAILP